MTTSLRQLGQTSITVSRAAGMTHNHANKSVLDQTEKAFNTFMWDLVYDNNSQISTHIGDIQALETRMRNAELAIETKRDKVPVQITDANDARGPYEYYMTKSALNLPADIASGFSWADFIVIRPVLHGGISGSTGFSSNGTQVLTLADYDDVNSISVMYLRPWEGDNFGRWTVVQSVLA